MAGKWTNQRSVDEHASLRMRIDRQHHRVKMDGFGGIRDVSAEITAEINSLDANFPHASRLLKEGAYLAIEALADCMMLFVCMLCMRVAVEAGHSELSCIAVTAELERHQKEQSEKMMDRSGIVKLTEKIYFSGKYEGAPKVCTYVRTLEEVTSCR